MRITTTRFGTVDVPADRVFHFPEGIPGFSGVRQFCLIDHPTASAFQWLQATEMPGLAFVVTNPHLFKPDYTIQVHRDELAPIDLDDVARAMVLVILVVPRDDPRKMTANLQGPLVFNVEKRLAKQVVLAGNQYPIKYPVFSERTRESSGTSATGSA